MLVYKMSTVNNTKKASVEVAATVVKTYIHVPFDTIPN